jgi:polysaccharide export outer membrane protein
MDSSYVIGPQDMLDIIVWKEPDVTKVVPVRPDGKISLPLINDVQAAGLTPLELGASLTELLKKYVTQPQVTVIVTQMNSTRIYVMGEVNHPGPMPLLRGLTVLQALASAGGFNQFANQKQIYILRTEGGTSKRYPFNYKNAIRGDMKQNIMLQSGDTIVVP